MSAFAVRIGSAVSIRVNVRLVVLCVGLAIASIGTVWLALASGSYHVSFREALDVLNGGGTHAAQVAVWTWRLPRALMAIVAGAALALSGAVFQSLTRNPLGSPDVIGFSNGAYFGAVLSMLVWKQGGPSTPVAALLGGVGTAVVVYLLAMKRGVQGFRLIIVGIAVGQILAGLTTWLILRAEVNAAIATAVWATGSLADVTWSQVHLVGWVVAGLAALLLFVSRDLHVLSLGDETARALGVPVQFTTLACTVLGVALTAIVTAYCGLIMFVALATPQIARRLARTAQIPFIVSAFTGAFLLSVSDWVAQHALGADLPVGVVTVSLGGGYLIYLLIQETRRQ